MFETDLIIRDSTSKNHEEIFDMVGKILYREGYVKNTFVSVIKKREEVFPTGLQLENIGIAIPHCDPENVINPCICLIIPKKAIKFQQMGSFSNEKKFVDAQLIFVIASKGGQEQLKTLMILMKLFKDTTFVDSLLNEENDQKLIQKLNERIEQNEEN